MGESWFNLGQALANLKEPQRALEAFRKALAIRRKVLPKDHSDIAQSLNNLGLVQ